MHVIFSNAANIVRVHHSQLVCIVYIVKIITRILRYDMSHGIKATSKS
jgi:hypothetical protein